MNKLMGSRTISQVSEDERKSYVVEYGDIITIEKFTHVWGEAGKPEGAPHIEKGSTPLKAGKGRVYNCIFLGQSKVEAPLSDEEIEKRLNKLGWYRREGADVLQK